MNVSVLKHTQPEQEALHMIIRPTLTEIAEHVLNHVVMRIQNQEVIFMGITV